MCRETTNRLLEMVDDGILDARELALACLKYMSEDDVKDMAESNEFLPDYDNEEEEEAEDSYDYILNVGQRKDDLQVYCAFPTKEDAIEAGRVALKFYIYSEVVYSLEDDVDTNEVVWRSWED